MISGRFLASLLLCLAGASAAQASCPAGTVSQNGQIENKPICVLRGRLLNSNVSLNSQNSYILEGDVRIGGDNQQNSTLTIEPGTHIYGSPGAFLVISRGSQILANGTASRPVVFTALERVNPTPGYWGGLVLTGRAPINNCSGSTSECSNTIEGVQTDAPMFGGSLPDDSSGRLNYVRVEYAGYTLNKDNELNAITFYGVGRGTEVNFIQAYKGADDGIEIFGGTVNLRYVVSIDSDDDGFDWDMGWAGSAQFVVIVMENASESDPRGIEGDNLKSPMDAQPRSNPNLSNITILTRGNNPRLLDGIHLRRGTGAQIYNTLIAGNFQNCISIADEPTYGTGLQMYHSMVSCESGVPFKTAENAPWTVSDWYLDPIKQNQVATPEMNGWLPVEEGNLVDTGLLPPMQIAGDWQFEPVDFIGALSPYEDEDWTAGWVRK